MILGKNIKHYWRANIVGLIFVVTGIGTLCAGCGSETTVELEPHDIKVHVAKVLADIARDIDAADETYSDKDVALTGKVDKITDGYVYLEAHGVPTENRIRCTLNEDELLPYVGDTITVVGRMDIDHTNRQARMRGCRIQ